MRLILAKLLTMHKAPLPVNETQRLHDLYGYGILDTPSDSDFDALVELASQICKCPISLITLLDKELQWFKAKIGIESNTTPRNAAFCSYAIMQDDVMVVEDATKDERFCNNPSVTAYPNVRFYAGAPIVSPTGHKLGTICIIDSVPRTLSQDEHRALVLLSNQATKLLEIRRKNILIRERSDEITRLKNNAINRYIKDIEDEKKAIASYLHEQFAQEIASSLVYLKMAEAEQTDEKNKYYQSAEQQLMHTLEDIRNLSYKITPLANQLLDTKDMISEYVKRIESSFPFKIHLSLPEISNSTDPDVLLTLVRMIELWLKVLNQQKNVTEVDIVVTLKPQLIIQITNNGNIINHAIVKKQIQQHILCDKIHLYGGDVDITRNTEKNTFTITLPLQHSEHEDKLLVV